MKPICRSGRALRSVVYLSVFEYLPITSRIGEGNTVNGTAGDITSENELRLKVMSWKYR
jgi:hypothetical protein